MIPFAIFLLHIDRVQDLCRIPINLKATTLLYLHKKTEASNTLNPGKGKAKLLRNSRPVDSIE